MERWTVIAPAGKESEVEDVKVEGYLERMLPGLAEVFKADKPRVRIWPMQLSYNGFTVVTKPTKEHNDGEGRRAFKRNIGVELSVDAIEIAKQELASAPHREIFSRRGPRC